MKYTVKVSDPTGDEIFTFNNHTEFIAKFTTFKSLFPDGPFPGKITVFNEDAPLEITVTMYHQYEEI